MRPWSAGWALASFALLNLATAENARAEPADMKAAAQVLFEKGRSLLEQGHFAEACPKFAESQRLAPGIGTMLWLADCFESSGQLASAWAAFKEAAAASAQRGDSRERVAKARAAALEPRLAKLNIVVNPANATPGLEVRRDGTIVGSAVWGLPIPLDPGVHSIAAAAPGRHPWSTTIEIRSEAEVLPITIPVLEPEPASASEPQPTSPQTPAEAMPGSRPGATQRAVGIGLAGAGVVGVVVGVVAAFSAKTTYDDSNVHCNAANQCDSVGKDDRSAAISKAGVATVAMAAGAAALIGGGVVYFTAPTAKRASLALEPTARGGGLRLSLTF